MTAETEWQEFANYPDAASAEIMAGLLRSETIPVNVVADEPVPGLAHGFRVMVPSAMLHRARWIVSQRQLSEEELASVAIGQVVDGETPD